MPNRRKFSAQNFSVRKTPSGTRKPARFQKAGHVTRLKLGAGTGHGLVRDLPTNRI
jgi:hypothetical protein